MDIQSKILNKYNIDIEQENILQFYKIDNVDLSDIDLEKKIQDTRKRWNASLNGPNEKNAERDKKRLENADKYEAILRDKNLRKEIYKFYNKTQNSSSNNENVLFAQNFFSLIATTKKIKKSDVDFFFDYFPDMRKNKKEIFEILTKKMKVIGLGKEEKYEQNDYSETENPNNDTKNDSSPFIVNLFQKNTILKIQKAFIKYNESAHNEIIIKQYPNITNGLYDFLEIDNIKDAKEFMDIIVFKGREAYSVRQERGNDFIPLVDFFNILQSIGNSKDIIDNFQEFKLLLKYPALTPYMYSFVDMKASTLKELYKIAKENYLFRDETDFILTYYKQIYDNFGISNNGVKSLLRSAEKKTKQNEFLNYIDAKLHRNKNKKIIPFYVNIIHWLIYWPIFLMYFIFEIIKTIFDKLHYLAIPMGIVLFVIENIMLPKIWKGMYSFFNLFNIFSKSNWLSFLNDFMGTTGNNGIEVIIMSLITIIVLSIVYIIPPVFTGVTISYFADDFNKQFDWAGLDRTFKYILTILKQRTEKTYLSQKKMFIKNNLTKIFVNILCVILIIAIVIISPIGFKKFSETTGYFQRNTEFDTAESEEIYF